MSQQPPTPHDLTTRIAQAVILHRGGDREEARSRLASLWKETEEPRGDLLHRCTIAHYLVGTQDEPADQLHWALRALEAADLSLDQEVRTAEDEARLLAIRSLYPSLHLSLASIYLALDVPFEARRQLGRARGRCAHLPADAHGENVRAAIEQLARRLDPAS
ncbi:hypothetical protein [Streptomyces sp. NPDC005438]|uniref:hypothetical protein n=1 Tax=Streptomyces sp. NPDC005438 TaxID=3156880 RepID=UPI0033A870BE